MRQEISVLTRQRVNLIDSVLARQRVVRRADNLQIARKCSEGVGTVTRLCDVALLI